MWVKKCVKMRIMLFETENICLNTCTKQPLAFLEGSCFANNPKQVYFKKPYLSFFF